MNKIKAKDLSRPGPNGPFLECAAPWTVARSAGRCDVSVTAAPLLLLSVVTADPIFVYHLTLRFASNKSPEPWHWHVSFVYDWLADIVTKNCWNEERKKTTQRTSWLRNIRDICKTGRQSASTDSSTRAVEGNVNTSVPSPVARIDKVVCVDFPFFEICLCFCPFGSCCTDDLSKSWLPPPHGIPHDRLTRILSTRLMNLLLY